MANFEKPYWKTVFRESDGTASSSRLLTATIVFAVILWVSVLTYREHKLPDLSPVATFVASTVSSLYGVNRVTDVIASITGKKANPPE